jgi:hypothetical protein
MLVVSLSVSSKNIFIGVALETEPRISGALDQEALIGRTMHNVTCLANDMILLITNARSMGN